MILLVGLGNPGAEYRFTRHNIGFLVLDAVQEAFGFSPWREKFKGLISEGTIGTHKILLLKPQTYMNLSGQSVAATMQFYKITPRQVMVIHDDLDLAPKKIRVKMGGSSGGHKGLNDIDQRIGKNYTRLRIGIGHPRDGGVSKPVTAYVLETFAKEDLVWVGNLVELIIEYLPLLLEGDTEKFVSKIMQESVTLS